MRWLLDHGAKVNAVTAAEYSYLPRYFAPGYGNEVRVPRGATPLQIASSQHEKTKWSSSRYRPVVELLRAHGVTGASLAPEVTTFLAIAASVGLIPFGLAFFAGVLFLDAHMTGWHRLATRFPAAAEPPNVYRRQNGGVGAFGLIQLRGLLRAAADQRGLYLAFPRFLCFAHAPFQVPWSEPASGKGEDFARRPHSPVGGRRATIARIYLRGGISQAVANSLTTALSK